MTKIIKNDKITFTKEQLLKSKQFTLIEKDILKVILKDEKYTVEKAKEKIKDFLKRKVK